MCSCLQKSQNEQLKCFYKKYNEFLKSRNLDPVPQQHYFINIKSKQYSNNVIEEYINDAINHSWVQQLLTTHPSWSKYFNLSDFENFNIMNDL